STLEARRGSLDLIRKRFEKGVVSALDVHQAEIQESIAAAAVPDIDRRVVETEDRIRILLGRFPGEVPRGRKLQEQTLPPEIPAGLVSDLLRRRPDVLASVREVEDALAAVRTWDEQVEAFDRQVVAARAALGLAEARYEGGVASYLEVLIQQTTAFSAELGASQAHREQLVSIVRLYSALGGGW